MASASVTAQGSVLSQQASSSSSRVRAGLWGTESGHQQGHRMERPSQGLCTGCVGESPRLPGGVAGPGCGIAAHQVLSSEHILGIWRWVLLETGPGRSSNILMVTQPASGRGYRPQTCVLSLPHPHPGRPLGAIAHSMGAWGCTRHRLFPHKYPGASKVSSVA